MTEPTAPAAAPVGWADAPTETGAYYVLHGQHKTADPVKVYRNFIGLYCEEDHIESRRWQGRRWLPIPTPEALIADADALAAARAEVARLTHDNECLRAEAKQERRERQEQAHIKELEEDERIRTEWRGNPNG